MANEKHDGYRPTPNLRFVEREQIPLGMSFADTVVMAPVLQQRWTSDRVGEQDQWRDVPVATEDE